MLSSGQSLAIPAHLQGANLGVNANLLATAGLGGNRIGFKANRFRIIINGKEEAVVEDNHLDVIVVGAVGTISRIFYEGAYDADTKAAPTCYSADGLAPADDVKNKQAARCDMCPQNQKGSKVIGGQKIKACAYFQRLVVMLPGDESGHLYRVDVKAMGLFGDSKPSVNKFNLRDYAKMVANRGVDVASLITRLSFDIDSSVPKLLFAPNRFINAEEFEAVSAKVGTPEVDALLKVDMTTVDLSGEVDKAPAQEEKAPVQEQVQEVPVEKAPVAAKPAPAADAGKKKVLPTEKAGEFTLEEYVAQGWTLAQLVQEGYAYIVEPPKPVAPKPEPPKPAAAPPKPVAPKPAPAPAAAPKAPPKPAGAPTVVKSVAPPPEAETVREVGSDAEIDDILAGLE
jgi:hypothetical protein